MGWWGEGSNPTPGPPLGYGPKARSASFGCMTGRVRARVAAGGSRRLGRRWCGRRWCGRRRRSRRRRGRRQRGGRRCGDGGGAGGGGVGGGGAGGGDLGGGSVGDGSVGGGSCRGRRWRRRWRRRGRRERRRRSGWWRRQGWRRRGRDRKACPLVFTPAASEHMGTPVVCATCSDLGWDLTGRCKVSDLITRALLTDGSGQLLLDVTRRHGLCAEARAS